MANQKSSQFIKNTASRIKDSIRNSGFDYETALERVKGRINRERPRIFAVYGEMSDGDVGRVLRVEDEQDECAGCDGMCIKDFFRYKKPIAQVINGLVYVSNVPCEFGIASEFRFKCFQAGIPQRFVGREFSDYRIAPTNDRAVKIARGFIEKRPGRGLYLYGTTGTGKTFLASLIAQSFIRDGKNVAFYDMPALLGAIKNTFDTQESTSALIDRICKTDLLILDDMGAERVTDWTTEQLYLIVNRRYNEGRPLIATSNFDFSGLGRRLGNDLTAQRIVSRLVEMCAQAFFGTVDGRLNQ